MDKLKETIGKILELAGVDARVEIGSENNQLNIFIDNEGIVENFFPRLMMDLEHLVRVIAKKLQIEKVNVDVNNYKKERERLITELAKAAARKVLVEKKEVELPAMNAYERRIVHMELAARPDVKTESAGDGGDRHIIVKPL